LYAENSLSQGRTDAGSVGRLMTVRGWSSRIWSQGRRQRNHRLSFCNRKGRLISRPGYLFVTLDSLPLKNYLACIIIILNISLKLFYACILYNSCLVLHKLLTQIGHTVYCMRPSPIIVSSLCASQFSTICVRSVSLPGCPTNYQGYYLRSSTLAPALYLNPSSLVSFDIDFNFWSVSLFIYIKLIVLCCIVFIHLYSASHRLSLSEALPTTALLRQS